MVCPKCGTRIPENDTLCRRCGYRVPAQKAPVKKKKKRRPILVAPAYIKVLFWSICILISVVVLGVGIYKGYFWIASVRLSHYYEDHDVPAPMVDEVTLSDGRPGRALTFYGNDGDLIYISELRRSYMIVAGVARVEIPDGEWFSANPDEEESADIRITPVLIAANGKRTSLPPISFTVEAPFSPLKVTSPANDFEEIYAGNYVISASVTPGSKVLVDGQDVSAMMDYYGNLEINVAVYPQGENVISIVVETPHHKQSRRDVIIYRERFEVPMEITCTFPEQSTRPNFTVTGKTDPTAQIVVDTPYVEDSIVVKEDGSFSFDAKFEVIGDNTVTFRAVQPGKKDTIIEFETYYLPSLAEYSKKAWIMDYKELCKCVDVWKGRVFLCRGYHVETIMGEPSYFVVNLGSEGEPKYVVLENQSAATSMSDDASYDIYADLAGQYKWHDKYYPLLVARYINKTKTE